jgi:hypothetical protein
MACVSFFPAARCPLRAAAFCRQTLSGVVLVIEKLNRMADALDVPRYRASEWPANPKALATQLRRHAPNLRRNGIEIQWLRRSSEGYPVRITQRPADGPAEEVNVIAS